MTLFSWSKTAASNDSADATINWLEGQAPSTVNNSARAMMAAVAKYRDDVSGSNPTSGTSSAYTLTSNQAFTSLSVMDADVVAFTPHVTNAASATLNVDGLGAKSLTMQGQALAAGALIAGTPYVAYYDNASGTFKLRDVYVVPWSLPIGAIVPYAGSSAPNSNFALCQGQAISRSTFATLFALVSTTYGVGDGSTTFNIPDLRGRVPAGIDASQPTSTFGSGLTNRINSTASGGLNTDTGNIKGDAVASTGGSQLHTQTGAETGTNTHSHSITEPNSGQGHQHSANATGGNVFVYAGTGVGSQLSGSGTVTNTVSTTALATTGISIVANSNASASSAMAWLQPTIILPFIIRVL